MSITQLSSGSNILIKRLNNSVILPNYATIGSSGLDLYASITHEIELDCMERVLINTGIIIELPEGYEGQIRSKSGLALNYGIIVLNSPGTIDSDYRGEIKVILYNTSMKNFIIKPNMKIAQLVISKYKKVNLIQYDPSIDLERSENTERGNKGFGSTGL